VTDEAIGDGGNARRPTEMLAFLSLPVGINSKLVISEACLASRRVVRNQTYADNGDALARSISKSSHRALCHSRGEGVSHKDAPMVSYKVRFKFPFQPSPPRVQLSYIEDVGLLE
jgi:hypothetical protein